MRSFLERLSSRKFLLALATQVASVVALFSPQQGSALQDGAIRIAALVTLLLAAMGYGKIEAAVDAKTSVDDSTASAEMQTPAESDTA